MPEVGQYGPDQWKDGRGNWQRSVATSVYEDDGTTLATLYATQAGTTTITNPIPTGVAQGAAGEDTAGNFFFYAEPGAYVLVGRRGGTEIYRAPITVDVDTATSGAATDHGTLSGLGDDDHTDYLTEARHDALAADNPHSVTVTQTVAADSGTDISAAELETLSDGSNADALHEHGTELAVPEGTIVGRRTGEAGVEAMTYAQAITDIGVLPTVSSGAGSPSSTPTAVGDIYVDTTGDTVWSAAGTASSADWKQATGAGGGDLLAANNLSDVANAGTSRTNLGLAIGTDVQAWDADLDAVSGTNTGDEVAASDTVAGVVELATIAEVDTGTDATRAVTPDALEGSALAAAVTANTAKVSNATHTGEVTGSGALTVDKTAITGQSSVTAATDDVLLISDTGDSGNLKKVTAQSIADLGGGGGTGAAAATNPPWPIRTGRYYTMRRNTTGYASIAANFVQMMPYMPHETFTADRIICYTQATATGLVRLGIYLADGAGGLPDTLLVDGGSVDTSGSTGERSVTISQSLTAGTRYWFAANPNVATQMTNRIPEPYAEPGFGMADLLGGSAPHTYKAATFGALPSSVATATWNNSFTPHIAVRAA